MRVLLDECLPRRLRRDLPRHEVRTVVEEGWSGIKNGALLRKAAGEFDVFLTVDSNLAYQQNTATLPIAVVVLAAYKNDADTLRPLMPEVLRLLERVHPGGLYRVGFERHDLEQ